jgi:Tannase and feruloyl esterase
MKYVKAFFRLGLCPTLLSLPLGAASCDSLATLKLPSTTITAAQVVAPGAFVPPGPAPTAAALAPFKSLPAFCRVQGVIQPSSDSHIEFEVWLPVSGWNRDYMGVGNGGFAGSIRYAASSVASSGNDPGMAEELAAGFAVSSTDTGHKGAQNDGTWALGHPEKVLGFGYRAIHETAEKSKATIRAFYGNGPKHSYFDGCSGGGNKALMEAQRFPADYDGIIAGAPAYYVTHDFAAWTVTAQATEADPASYIPASKLPAIESAALAACDALDGLKDGLIDDPRKCHFDPATLLCQAAESSGCLTQPQVAALKKLYAGPRTSKGDRIYPGYFVGGETGAYGWNFAITGSGPGTSVSYIMAVQAGKYLIFQNPAWDYRSFDVDRDVKIADDAMGQRANATDPNLKSFKSRGGKLILFHGWSDALIAPTNTIDYYESVAAKMGRKDAASFTRLYMVPGMQHCYGGPGPNNFGNAMIAALQHWAEQGSAPDKILATKYKTDGDPSSGVARTRPLCPYPQVARYQGSGSIDDAANFACRIP